MALARVVVFDDVDSARIAEMTQEMQSGERPPDVPATEFVILHDPGASKAVAILYFDNEDDYQTADAALNAMPAGETPGRRASVTRYDVALRMTA